MIHDAPPRAPWLLLLQTRSGAYLLINQPSLYSLQLPIFQNSHKSQSFSWKSKHFHVFKAKKWFLFTSQSLSFTLIPRKDQTTFFSLFILEWFRKFDFCLFFCCLSWVVVSSFAMLSDHNDSFLVSFSDGVWLLCSDVWKGYAFKPEVVVTVKQWRVKLKNLSALVFRYDLESDMMHLVSWSEFWL